MFPCFFFSLVFCLSVCLSLSLYFCFCLSLSVSGLCPVSVFVFLCRIFLLVSSSLSLLSFSFISLSFFASLSQSFSCIGVFCESVLKSYCLMQTEVMEICLDKTGSATERRLAIVDRNRDLYLTQVRVFGTARKTVKLGKFIGQIQSYGLRLMPLPSFFFIMLKFCKILIPDNKKLTKECYMEQQ